MTNFGLTAIALAAATAISLLSIDAANAKSKKHDTSPPAPVEKAQSVPDGKGASAKDAAGETQKPAAGEKGSEVSAKEPPADKWSDSEIADAKAHCDAVLKRIHAVYAAHEPIRDGACGAPAPIELISIGQNPEVTFSPPPVVRCDLAETLVNWLEKDLQPLAKKHFGAPIVRIETMSGYSCRNAFGRKTTKLSEHGLANALDIGAFVTASAKSVSVLDDWGTTRRELAEIAEKKAAAEKQAAELAAAEKAQQTNLASEHGTAAAAAPVAATPSSLGAPAAGLARSTIVDGVPKVTVTLPGASAGASKTASRAGEPARLGGPAPGSKGRAGKSRRKDVAAAVNESAAVSPASDDQAFLQEAHVAACRLFGTTLGPEANRDHRNHFHVDMAARKFTKICD